MIRLDGSINSIIYQNDDHWSIISFDTIDRNITLNIVQEGLKEGDFIEVFGDFSNHPKFGEQFRVVEFFYKKPKTKEKKSKTKTLKKKPVEKTDNLESELRKIQEKLNNL